MNQPKNNQTALHDASLSANWRSSPVRDRNSIRSRLILKHGQLGNASVALNKDYFALNHVLAGRIATKHIVAAIQQDLELTNEQVLQLWPRLKSWPHPGRGA